MSVTPSEWAKLKHGIVLTPAQAKAFNLISQYPNLHVRKGRGTGGTLMAALTLSYFWHNEANPDLVLVTPTHVQRDKIVYRELWSIGFPGKPVGDDWVLEGERIIRGLRLSDALDSNLSGSTVVCDEHLFEKTNQARVISFIWTDNQPHTVNVLGKDVWAESQGESYRGMMVSEEQAERRKLEYGVYPEGWQ